ncbi:21805_t:CDS:2, partial [Racocetra persica]
GKNGDNTDEYTPNKFYNDDGLSRTSERRDQPQRRRSDNRSRQYQQYAQYAQNITTSPQDSNQSPQSFVEQDGQVINNDVEDEDNENENEENSDFFQTAFRPTTGDNHTSFYKRSMARTSVTSDETPDATGAQTRRQKSLVKPERARNRRVMNDQRIDQNNIENLNNRWSTFDNNRRDNDDRKNQGRPSGERRSSPIVQKKKKCQCPSAWVMFSRCITCWAPPFLSCCGMNDVLAQHAWREKVALVVIIFTLCIAVGFLTFGFDQVFCGAPPQRIGAITNSQISILGRVFNIKGFTHPPIPGMINSTNFERTAGGNDLSFLFQGANIHCKGLFIPIQPADSNGNVINYFPCVALSNNDPMAPNTSLNPTQSGCHGSTAARRNVLTLKSVGDIFYDWDDVQSSKHNYVVFNG